MRRTINPTKKGNPKGLSPMDAALKYLENRPRTAREVERRLDECEFGEVEISDTVDRLIELGLVNDAAYAEDFIRTRLETKPVSRAHLREQLLMHEVDRDALDAALMAVTDETEANSARQCAEKYARQFAGKPMEERAELVVKRLLARGYSFDLARRAAETAVCAEETE